MSVDVIIPNYNGSALVRKNLPQVLSEVRKYKAGIIIVDDCSNLDDFEALKEIVEKSGKDSKITLIRNERNYGFSSTVDRGVSESKAEYVVLLNTDVSPDKDFLKAPLVDLEQNTNLFGVGMMDKSVEGANTIKRGRGIAEFKRGFLVHARGEVTKRDTFWVSGGSSVIRRELFVKLGGFDSLYNPFYWEDIDLSYRAVKSGFDLLFENKSTVVHKHEEGAIKKHYKSFRIKTIAYRNQFIFVWKNITDPRLFISHFFWLPYHTVSALIRFDIPFFLGFIYAFARLPAIINKRSEQSKYYKLTDAQVINKK